MSMLTDLAERLRTLFFRSRENRELREEIEYHIELETAKNIRHGMDPAEARRRARIAVGSAARIGEDVQDASGVRPLEEFARDVRHSCRTLARRPGFTIVAVATLAIGIGASTAMFTLVNSVLLRPLAYAEPQRLVWVAERLPNGAEATTTSPRTVTAWRKQSTTFEAIAAYTDRQLILRDAGSGEAAEVRVRLATGEYFPMLGARARLGRALLPGDHEEQRVVLSHALWQSRYGGDPGVIGRIITLNDQPTTVVGVMPDDFHSVGGQPEVWAAMEFTNPDWLGRYLQVIARLRPGATVEAAQAELATVATRLSAEHPESHRNWGVAVIPLQQQVTGKARPALLLLLGAVSLLLLIACANVASLFLGRATSRRKEMAVRRSLGASRGRLIMQTMSEALVVAAIAGVVGVLLAYWGTGVVVRLLPAGLALPRLDEVAIDPSVLAFALGVSALTGLLFGAAPALNEAGVDPGNALRESARGVAGRRSRLRGALVVAEVALAMMLLAGAGLLVRTIQNLMDVDTGLEAEGVLTMSLALSGPQYAEDVARREFVRELLPRLAALPGRPTVGTTGALPLSGAKAANPWFRNDKPKPAPGEEPNADYRVVSGDYFAAMGMRMIRGRAFDSSDDERVPPRFIVNEALARRYFPGEDPVGKHITFEWYGPQSGEIVGVVGSVREMALDKDPSPAVYRPHAQDPWPQMSIVARTAGNPMLLGPAAIAAVREVAPSLPAPRLRTLEQVMTDTLSRQRLTMFLLVGFAAVSLLLVVIGLYGVISYSVAERTRELGVRIALGAQRADVLRMILGEGIALAAIGVVLGLLGALALSRLIASLLFGVTATDPLTLGVVASILAGTALLASFVPAHRATRIDPATVLGAGQ